MEEVLTRQEGGDCEAERVKSSVVRRSWAIVSFGGWEVLVVVERRDGRQEWKESRWV